MLTYPFINFRAIFIKFSPISRRSLRNFNRKIVFKLERIAGDSTARFSFEASLEKSEIKG